MSCPKCRSAELRMTTEETHVYHVEIEGDTLIAYTDRDETEYFDVHDIYCAKCGTVIPMPDDGIEWR